MIPRTSLPDELLALAVRQANVLSRAQVMGFGVSPRVIERLLRDDVLRPIARGVYSTGPTQWLQHAWAGVLLGGGSAVLGLSSAAFVQRLTSIQPPQVDVFVGTHGRVDRDPRWRFIRSDRLGSGEPPRTRPAQTVVDLSAELDPDGVAALVATAVGQLRVSPRAIQQVLEGRARHARRQLLRSVLADVAAGAESALEVRYAHDVERAHGLPQAERQGRPTGHHRCDCWYRHQRVIVELDGTQYHQGGAALRDMERDNLHRMSGLITLRFGWQHVTLDPCSVARQVSLALHAGGWEGLPRLCRRCR